ncbi:hypothetical protein [Gellertiella hungarica]|uniref:Uncharacterized protein n=1 Tax=Gellertiella hungarica TaxID=1572859 RepID=A0A7W6JAT5_9HYPH|nr:hypothetical protein [Gellertiella hungarica]MBB4067011.1 hypothetical protein [Gellertiella hungarica]
MSVERAVSKSGTRERLVTMPGGAAIRTSATAREIAEKLRARSKLAEAEAKLRKYENGR